VQLFPSLRIRESIEKVGKGKEREERVDRDGHSLAAGNRILKAAAFWPRCCCILKLNEKTLANHNSLGHVLHAARNSAHTAA